MSRALLFLFLLFAGDSRHDDGLGEHCYVCRLRPCSRWEQVVIYRQVGGCTMSEDIINETCESYQRYLEESDRTTFVGMDPDYYYLIPKFCHGYHHKFGCDFQTRGPARYTKPTHDTSPYECEVEAREILRKRNL